MIIIIKVNDYYSKIKITCPNYPSLTIEDILNNNSLK